MLLKRLESTKEDYKVLIFCPCGYLDQTTGMHRFLSGKSVMRGGVVCLRSHARVSLKTAAEAIPVLVRKVQATGAGTIQTLFS